MRSTSVHFSLSSARTICAVTVIWLATAFSLSSQSFATVYVDRDASPGGDGNSWGTAYQTIQAGIDDADALDEEVWVAEGSYSEQRVSVMHDPPVDTGSLVMREGVDIYGGFAGTESSRDQRDWETRVTTIDGSTARAGNAAYHVLVGANNATIDGFTITGGYAHGPVPNARECYGAGMYNDGCSPAVSNCTFLNNSASYGGGGMANFSVASPTVTNCVFSGNDADWGAGIYTSTSTSVITNCLFSGNSASSDGGAIYSSSCSLTVTKCVFSNNSVDVNASEERRGGAMFSAGCSSSVTNCVFASNSCQDGGGMYDLHSPLTIINCTFLGNSLGGAIYNSGGSPTITNCILWNDSPREMYNELGSDPIVTYCDIQGGYTGEGNISVDPQFVNAAGGDLHLQPGSPCVDAGCSIGGLTQDFEGDPRPHGSGFDIGADEYFDAAADSDGDGLKDSDELDDLDPGTPDVQNPFDPLDPDTTGDGFSDVADGVLDGQNDYDGDGMSNADEFTFGYNPIDPGSWAEVPAFTGIGLFVLIALALAARGRGRERAPR